MAEYTRLDQIRHAYAGEAHDETAYFQAAVNADVKLLFQAIDFLVENQRQWEAHQCQSP